MLWNLKVATTAEVKWTPVACQKFCISSSSWLASSFFSTTQVCMSCTIKYEIHVVAEKYILSLFRTGFNLISKVSFRLIFLNKIKLNHPVEYFRPHRPYQELTTKIGQYWQNHLGSLLLSTKMKSLIPRKTSVASPFFCTQTSPPSTIITATEASVLVLKKR